MAWDARFIAALGSPTLHPRWLLQTVVDDNEFQSGSSLFLSSHPQGGYRQLLTPEGTRFSGGLLHPVDWRQTFSQLEVGVRATADTVRSWLIARRGTLVQLRLGFAGWAAVDYEPVFTGVLVGARRSAGDRWVLQLRSVVSALQSRFTTTQSETQLFYDGAWQTTLAVSYTVGDPTIDTVSAPNGSPVEDGSTTRLIRVTPDSGEPFLLLATGASATQFTGLGTGQLGTTRGDASIGNLVEVLPFTYSTPLNAVRKLVDSTGTPGRNGQFDVLPQDWGLACPQEVWDADDLSITAMAIDPGAGVNRWHVYGDEPLDDALSWLISWLAPAGILLTEHHGLLSMRPVKGPTSHPYGTVVLTDADLVSIEGYDWWDSTVPLEASTVNITTPDGGSIATDVLESKPALDAVAYHQPFIEDDQSLWRVRISQRLAPWAYKIPEAVELVLRGWRWATLAMGDHVRIRSNRFRSRTDETDPAWLVLSVEPDWFGVPSVRIRAVFVPSGIEF